MLRSSGRRLVFVLWHINVLRAATCVSPNRQPPPGSWVRTLFSVALGLQACTGLLTGVTSPLRACLGTRPVIYSRESWRGAIDDPHAASKARFGRPVTGSSDTWTRNPPVPVLVLFMALDAGLAAVAIVQSRNPLLEEWC